MLFFCPLFSVFIQLYSPFNFLDLNDSKPCRIPKETSTASYEPKVILPLFPERTFLETFLDQICLFITLWSILIILWWLFWCHTLMIISKTTATVCRWPSIWTVRLYSVLINPGQCSSCSPSCFNHPFSSQQNREEGKTTEMQFMVYCKISRCM